MLIDNAFNLTFLASIEEVNSMFNRGLNGIIASLSREYEENCGQSIHRVKMLDYLTTTWPTCGASTITVTSISLTVHLP